jgi:hypothetical protein
LLVDSSSSHLHLILSSSSSHLICAESALKKNTKNNNNTNTKAAPLSCLSLHRCSPTTNDQLPNSDANYPTGPNPARPVFCLSTTTSSDLHANSHVRLRRGVLYQSRPQQARQSRAEQRYTAARKGRDGTLDMDRRGPGVAYVSSARDAACVGVGPPACAGDGGGEEEALDKKFDASPQTLERERERERDTLQPCPKVREDTSILWDRTNTGYTADGPTAAQHMTASHLHGKMDLAVA